MSLGHNSLHHSGHPPILVDRGDGFLVRQDTGEAPFPVGERVVKLAVTGSVLWGLVLGVKQIQERWLFDVVFDDGTRDMGVHADVVRRMLAEASHR